MATSNYSLKTSSGLPINANGKPDPEIFRGDDVKENGALPEGAEELLRSYYGGDDNAQNRRAVAEAYIKELLNPNRTSI
jgi:hypothetical protein